LHPSRTADPESDPADDDDGDTDRAQLPGAGRSRKWIPLSSVDLSDREHGYVSTALNDGWISGTGPFVERFESRLSERVTRRHTVAVATGTLALDLALRVLEIGPGDEVIVPSLTFAAPALSVLAVGADPILADIAPDTWTLSVNSVAEKLTPRTKAIIAVDVFGHPADYDRLEAFGVPVIEDAAEAHGARYKGRITGSLGRLSVFSFGASKAVVTGEGGCLCTDDPVLAERARLVAHHGMDPRRPYVHEVVGRNFRMNNLAAAVGLGQLDRWDELIAARRRISQTYDDLLAGAGCEARPIADWAEYSCWLHTVTVRNRDGVVAYLRDRGVDARAIWPALTAQPILAGTSAVCPIAEDVSRRGMWLPTYNTLRDEDMHFVADGMRAAINSASA
jgi:perosamine synthetase